MAKELSATLKREIDALRKPLTQFATEFGRITESRAELAPRFMKAYAHWMQETGGVQFVAFVRVVDPTVPEDRDGYKAHKSYQAADYLRRLAGRRDTQGRATKPVRSNLQAMARLLATLMPLVKDQDAVWTGIGAELGFKTRQLSNLKRTVATVKPLLDLHTIKPVATAKIVHMPTPEPEAPVVAEEPKRETRKRKAA